MTGLALFSPPGAKNLVAVRNGTKLTPLMREIFQGWRIIAAGQSIPSARFDRVVLAFTPQTENEKAWVLEGLLQRIRPGQVLETFE